MIKPGLRQSQFLDRLSAENLRDEDAVRYAVSTIKDPDKMKGFRDDLAKSIRDDPNFHRGEKDSFLKAEKSIRDALVDPSISYGQFTVWIKFLLKNATPPIDQEVRPTLPKQAGR
jgi:hypothetical protein